MLPQKAVVAYAVASLLAVASIVTGWRATQVPWLENEHDQSIGLWKFVTRGDSIEFPDQLMCYNNPSFCASWRTATFLFTLVLLPETLSLLAIIFSWAFHHRKKTVWVVKYLLAFSLAAASLGMSFWWMAYSHIVDVLATDGWRLVGGWRLVVLSMMANATLFGLMFRFREIVRDEIRLPEHWLRGDGDSVRPYRSLDSDDSDGDSLNGGDDDDISVPDDIAPEQIDYYIFTKRARRQELARRLR